MTSNITNPHVWTSETLEAMKSVGWSPSRSVPESITTKWKAALQTDGFQLFPSAQRILMEFGGLRYTAQRRAGIDHSPLSFYFDPMVAIGERDRLDGYESVLSSALCPIGEAENGHAFIVADENGCIFLIMDDIAKIGDDVHDAIENMVKGAYCNGDRL